jgi:hypothetical protein
MGRKKEVRDQRDGEYTNEEEYYSTSKGYFYEPPSLETPR